MSSERDKDYSLNVLRDKRIVQKSASSLDFKKGSISSLAKK
jgi:hypothetical protein